VSEGKPRRKQSVERILGPETNPKSETRNPKQIRNPEGIKGTSFLIFDWGFVAAR
jgi:hypothetical protein